MLFWCLQFSQKTNGKNSTWVTIVVKSNFFIRFLGELKLLKRHFEINWPLAEFWIHFFRPEFNSHCDLWVQLLGQFRNYESEFSRTFWPIKKSLTSLFLFTYFFLWFLTKTIGMYSVDCQWRLRVWINQDVIDGPRCMYMNLFHQLWIIIQNPYWNI